jgi:hypothetical protein
MTELKTLIESGKSISPPITKPTKKTESLHDRITRLSKVDSATIESGQYVWIDEVVLVALGKKPIAMTHFDALDDDWNEEVEDWCVEQCGVSSFSVMSYPPYLEYDLKKLPCVYFTDVKGKKYERIISATNEVDAMIWFRPETRKFALVARHFHRLHREGKNWLHPYFDIIQGLLYGYSEENIIKFMKKSYPLLNHLDSHMTNAKNYIGEVIKTYTHTFLK